MSTLEGQANPTRNYTSEETGVSGLRGQANVVRQINTSSSIDTAGLERDHVENTVTGIIDLENSSSEIARVYNTVKIDQLISEATGSFSFDKFAISDDGLKLELILSGTKRDVLLSDLTKDVQNQINEIVNEGIVTDVTYNSTTPSLTFMKNNGDSPLVVPLATPIDMGQYSTTVEMNDAIQSALVGLEKDHIVNGNVVTAINSSDEEVEIYNTLAVDEKITDLQTQFNAVVLEKTGANSPLTTTMTKVLEFDPIVVSGKYDGVMRGSYNASTGGTRQVNLEIYLNGVATGLDDVNYVTDNQTISNFTAMPLELVSGDVVSVYASSATGSVEEVQGALKLILSNSSISLDGLEKDHTVSTDGKIATLTTSNNETVKVLTDENIIPEQRVLINSDIALSDADTTLFGKWVYQLCELYPRKKINYNTYGNTNLENAIKTFLNLSSTVHYTINVTTGASSDIGGMVQLIPDSSLGESYNISVNHYKTINSIDDITSDSDILSIEKGRTYQENGSVKFHNRHSKYHEITHPTISLLDFGDNKDSGKWYITTTGWNNTTEFPDPYGVLTVDQRGGGSTMCYHSSANKMYINYLEDGVLKGWKNVEHNIYTSSTSTSVPLPLDEPVLIDTVNLKKGKYLVDGTVAFSSFGVNNQLVAIDIQQNNASLAPNTLGALDIVTPTMSLNKFSSTLPITVPSDGDVKLIMTNSLGSDPVPYYTELRFTKI